MSDLVWQITTPSGARHIVDDFTIDDLEAMATAAGQSWYLMMRSPFLSGAGAKALYLHACALTGDDPPDPLTARVINEAFTAIDEDLPAEYQDGIPKAEGATGTPSSSGAPTASGGRRKS